ncbi:MAG: Pin protein [Candidatus Methanoperedens nitroreducens]|uniref:Ribonuclease VapC n=1 Tax=Candidatus Methanoperedens nitratireducens TaxID=1392998 RepID=A0A0P8CBI1_9EURY|nr:type II toxin-antitoxin system VapC family toxin [Candidatus Methanoperedens sp. BLZ2]KPQ44191.1 MAG: Pin protein [Candidatus Methanoperedens sp. BLZ1]MCX9076994.1 type II toxin-antitoxin system VapC family toxin [Candidatus Methanoperedens sp.]MCX9086840.1 type II toxin-antitoxin system VapC family toxin [Candidatus Methanoperedens sp.]CAG1007296.1 Ribonuclease VapC2 [Methanosarcinales archaeon]
MKVFIDTSIFVDCLRTNSVTSSKDFLETLEGSNNGFTSSIVVAELSVGAYLSKKTDALEKTLKIISTTSVIDLDKEIAILGGKIYSNLIREGKEIELNDCLIAATAVSYGIKKVVTRNIDHFNKIKDLKAVTPEELDF